MELIARNPLIDAFKRGDVPREVRLQAAEGGVAARALDQLELLVMLAADADADVAAAAERTLQAVPAPTIASLLARGDTAPETKVFFAARGVQPAAAAVIEIDAPLVDAVPAVEPAPPEEKEETALQRIANMNVAKRIALAMKGTREERGILIRDPNRIVTAAVLSSPKMTDTEIAAIARMANVSEDVLRTIALNRAWLKNYQVILGLAKNPKTPIALSMNLLARLNEKDLKLLSTDRNVPDVLRVSARKKIVIDK